MADQPSAIAREAKSIYQSVKELLQNRDPFDKELDFQRKNLRRRYLSLLLVHPYAQESKDAETRLWMETSHSFISSYKQRISKLDQAIQRTGSQQQGGRAADQNQHGHGPVEHRKLVQRFRQFLADEEKFWTQFVVRFRRSFALDEAHKALADLGLTSEETDNTAGVDSAGLPHNGGRNHFQFPPVLEDPTSLIPKTDAQRESRMEILSKALTCLGDIARYREQYNEAGGRPRAGHEDHSGPGGRRGRRGRGGGGANFLDLPRPRNYEKARHCYEQAKLLVPHQGNPSHQLAILASYQKDLFTSLVHYYRALCVRHPYDSASENINTVLHKALEQLSAKRKNGDAVENLANEVPKIRIEAFKKRVVDLHALHRVGTEKYDNGEAKGVFQDFSILMSERHLPEDFIVQVIVLSQAALWKHRMVRDVPKRNKNNSDARDLSVTGTLTPAVIEARLFTHVLSLHRALLELGIEQLREPVPLGSEDDLAQRIVAEFKRTLPALRIASKWLLANFKYVMQDPESLGVISGKGRQEKASNGNGKVNGYISATSTETILFWEKYAGFLKALARAFPMNRLPDLTFPLAEDVEMRGFLPLRGMLEWDKERISDEKSAVMSSAESDSAKTGDIPMEEKEVHPNVVQLMRIKDLLKDATCLTEMENTPLALYGSVFMLKGVEAGKPPVPSSDQSLEDPEYDLEGSELLDEAMRTVRQNGDRQDSMTEETSRTDDDPVQEAFHHLDNQMDEDDEIVWDPRGSPVASPALENRSPTTGAIGTSPLHSSPQVVPTPNTRIPLQQPTTSPSIQPASQTTAEDLLNGFMTKRMVPKSISHPFDTLAPSTSTPPLFNNNSIWSASQDEKVSMRTAASNSPIGPSISPQIHTHHLPHPHHDVRARTMSQGQSPWSLPETATVISAPSANQLVGHTFNGHSSPLSLSVGAQHRRVPSSSVTAQLFPDPIRNPGLSGFGYGHPSQQVVQHATETHLHPSFTGVSQRPSFGLGGSSIYDTSPSLHPNYELHDDVQHLNQHTRHLSLHDSSVNTQTFNPGISSIWGNGAG
ncbi:hypothetical protein VNI00_009626 [Paramarasmius palmivorus]|uniref:Protein SMG7 n=1 Tax=Paramarasmius palmivorus TaxID=297713 RepID=A0AAW0CLS7_9AGAR